MSQAQPTITARPEHGVGEQEMTVGRAANAIWNKLNFALAQVDELQQPQLYENLKQAQELADSIVHQRPG